MGARLFAALIPPAEIVADLDAFCEPRREAEPRLCWTPAANWHLTTVFCPDVDAGRIERLEEELAHAAARTPAPALALTGGGCFPDPLRATILFAGVAGDLERLDALAARCRTAAGRAGAVVDGARFRPHLTLARSGGGVDITRLLRVLDAYASASWLAEELALIESHLHDRGSRYEVVARFPLAAPEPGDRDTPGSASTPHLG